jgi:hypothetical protein
MSPPTLFSLAMIVVSKVVVVSVSDNSVVMGSGFLPMGKRIVNISVSAKSHAKAILINRQHIIAANMVYLLSD